MLENRPFVKVFLILVSAFAVLHAGSAMAETGLTGVFVSSKIRPYLDALDGFKSKTQRELLIIYLDDNLELAKHYLKSGNLDAAVAIGPEAAKIIYSSSVKIPVRMVIMTLDVKKLIPGADPCGIDLRVPISFQVSQIATHLGRGRKVAIIYNPGENADVISRAEKACRKAGLDLVLLPVAGSDEIMKRLAPQIDDIDVLLFIPDSTVISEKIVTHLTKEALLKAVAVVGYNHFFYETGALIAFTIDYRQVGINGAELLEEFAARHDCRLVPPPVEIEWNQKVFRLLKARNPERWSDIPGGITHGD